MIKKIPVVMLPTEKASSLVLGLTGRLKFDNKQLSTHPKIINQHLYFLSDEEIKEGDWVYNHILNDVVQIKTSHIQNPINFFTEINKLKHAKKIIATTDESLFEQIFYHPDGAIIGGIESYKLLPRPSQSFIERFIEKYNVGTPITHVMVEYESCEYEGDIFKGEKLHPISHKLKINPKDNTITIKPVKDSWTRKEHEKDLRDLAQLISNKHRFGDGVFDVDKWIEQNL
mgnify:CR=1 FL=1